jgi:subtilisin-like proprotein convertase family protein
LQTKLYIIKLRINQLPLWEEFFVRIFVLFILFLSVGAFAQETKTGGESIDLLPRGGCTIIPDDGYDGSIASMACITIAGPGGVITDLNAEITMEHTWIGDLTYKVVAPDNTTLTLMSRPGFAEPADDGSDCCGDSSDLQLADTLTFRDGGATSAELMGSTIIGTQFVCGDDGLCEYAPAPDTGPGTSFADFVGLQAAGNWQVCVGDSGLGDSGNLCSANLNFTIAIGAIATSTPSDGSTLNFGMGAAYNLTIGNDAGADTDLANISCSFAGGDAAEFSVTSGNPAGPVAPGGSTVVSLAANTPPDNGSFSSTLTCTFENDNTTGSFSWPVTVAGAYVPPVIPSTNFYGLMLLLFATLSAAVVVYRKKFI